MTKCGNILVSKSDYLLVWFWCQNPTKIPIKTKPTKLIFKSVGLILVGTLVWFWYPNQTKNPTKLLFLSIGLILIKTILVSKSDQNQTIQIVFLSVGLILVGMLVWFWSECWFDFDWNDDQTLISKSDQHSDQNQTNT